MSAVVIDEDLVCSPPSLPSGSASSDIASVDFGAHHRAALLRTAQASRAAARTTGNIVPIPVGSSATAPAAALVVAPVAASAAPRRPGVIRNTSGVPTYRATDQITAFGEDSGFVGATLNGLMQLFANSNGVPPGGVPPGGIHISLTDSRQIHATTNNITGMMPNPLAYLPGLQKSTEKIKKKLEPAEALLRSIFKDFVRPQTTRAARNIETYGYPTSIFFSVLLFLCFVYAYTITVMTSIFYTWILKAVTMSLVSIVPLLCFRWKKRYVCACIFLAAFLLQGMRDDEFMPSHIKERMNQDFYQRLDYLVSAADNELSVLSPYFVARKLLLSCSKKYGNSDVCQRELNEFQRIHNIFIPAIKAVLADPTITTPRDVQFTLGDQGEETHLGTSYKIAKFDDYVRKPLPAKDKPMEVDLFEIKLLAFAGARLEDGKFYYKNFQQWIKVQSRTYKWLGDFRYYMNYFSAFDSLLFGSYAKYLSYFKFCFIGIEKGFLWVFPEQTTVERLATLYDPSLSTRRADNTFDYCIVGRCHARKRPLKDHENLMLFRETTDNYAQISCPACLPKVFDFDACPLLKDRCDSAYNSHGSHVRGNCPLHCGQTVYLDVEDQVKREDMDKNEYNSRCHYYTNSTYGDEPGKPLVEKCETTMCKIKDSVNSFMDAGLHAIGTGAVLLFRTRRNH